MFQAKSKSVALVICLGTGICVKRGGTELRGGMAGFMRCDDPGSTSMDTIGSAQSAVITLFPITHRLSQFDYESLTKLVFRWLTAASRLAHYLRLATTLAKELVLLPAFPSLAPWLPVEPQAVHRAKVRVAAASRGHPAGRSHGSTRSPPTSASRGHPVRRTGETRRSPAQEEGIALAIPSRECAELGALSDFLLNAIRLKTYGTGHRDDDTAIERMKKVNSGIVRTAPPRQASCTPRVRPRSRDRSHGTTLQRVSPRPRRGSARAWGARLPWRSLSLSGMGQHRRRSHHTTTSPRPRNTGATGDASGTGLTMDSRSPRGRRGRARRRSGSSSRATTSSVDLHPGPRHPPRQFFLQVQGLGIPAAVLMEDPGH